MSDKEISKAVADEQERQKEDAEVRAPQQGSLRSRRPLSRLLRMLVCLFQGTRDHWSLILPFSRAPCATLPGQVQAIALERNELEALLFDMNAAPNKKHGELLDKYVSGACVCVRVRACPCVGCRERGL